MYEDLSNRILFIKKTIRETAEPVQEYGTSDGARKAWDTRGRGSSNDEYGYDAEHAGLERQRAKAEKMVRSSWDSLDTDRKGAALANAGQIMGWDPITFHSMLHTPFEGLPPQIQNYLIDKQSEGQI